MRHTQPTVLSSGNEIESVIQFLGTLDITGKTIAANTLLNQRTHRLVLKPLPMSLTGSYYLLVSYPVAFRRDTN